MKYTIIILLVGLMAFTIREAESTNSSNSELQKEALDILTAKCNMCHKTQNPSKVFTSDNMNDLASKINWQVFVFKRMPKGDDIKLSKTEKQVLKNWINSVK